MENKNIEPQEIIHIEREFQHYYPDEEFSKDFWKSIERFVYVGGLKIPFLVWAMSRACGKVPDDPQGACRYFCAICWARIKEDDKPATQKRSEKSGNDESLGTVERC